jgi:galactokinase
MEIISKSLKMQPESGLEFVRATFNRQFGSQDGGWPRLYQAPGRINIIGEHTDYNGGFVLPATIDLFTWIAARPRNDGLLRVYNCNNRQLHSLALNQLERGEKGQPVEYLKGVVWALQQDGLEPGGCDVAISGNIPLGGGLSSSASLELALSYALLDCSGIDLDRSRLALLCQRAEVEFVGAQCGIMDQYTIALAASGCAMMLDCRSLDFDHVAIPREVSFLAVHSGVSHRVSTGAYNSRRDECEEAVRLLSQTIPGISSLRDVSREQLEANRSLLGSTLHLRCRHVVTENQRVGEAETALRNKDLQQLGSLVNQSHNSLRDDFEVSCSELDRLVDIARNCDGVLGSRMMGAGFGGCTLNIVEPEAVTDAAARIRAEYASIIGHDPWMHVAAPAEAVRRIS